MDIFCNKLSVNSFMKLSRNVIMVIENNIKIIKDKVSYIYIIILEM